MVLYSEVYYWPVQQMSYLLSLVIVDDVLKDKTWKCIEI